MFFKHTKRFGYTLTDGDAWYNDDELRPTVEFVKFKHRLDVDVGLTRTGFHLNIKVDGTEAVDLGQRFGKRYACRCLHRVKIVEQLLCRQFYVSITISVIVKHFAHHTALDFA